MSDIKFMQFKLDVHKMNQENGTITEYNLGYLNAMLAMIDLAKNNEVLDLVSISTNLKEQI